MLSAQGDGRQPHNPTYLGLSPTVSLVLGPCLSPSSHFPFCHLNNFIFICPSASETPRLCRKACLAYLPRLKTEFLVAALTSSLPDLDRLPLLHFAQKVSSSSPMPRRCPGKVRAKSELSLSRPQDREHLATCLVGSPGARRLWTDWLPLRKKEGKKIPILLPLAANVSKYGVHQRGMLTYPPSLYAHLSSHQHRSRFPDTGCPCLCLLQILQMKSNRLMFHLCVRSGAVDCVVKREKKNQCSLKWEIKLHL